MDRHQHQQECQHVGCESGTLNDTEHHINNAYQPELHYFDGLWYIYYTAGSSANLDLQRPHVLKGTDRLYGS